MTSDDRDDGRPSLLSIPQQAEYLTLVRLGAPPALACQRVGVTFEDVAATQDRNDVFRERLELAQHLLAANVQAAMYKSAMNGSVFAQSQFLRHCRPPKREPDPDRCKDVPMEDLKDSLRACVQAWDEEEQQASASAVGSPEEMHD